MTTAAAGQPPSPMRRAIGASVVLAAALPVGRLLRPTRRGSASRTAIALEQQVPRSFAGWRTIPGASPVLPDARLQATLAQTYAQVLARNYADPASALAMLSIAYGDDQSGETTAVHRPEFCYRAQGFEIDDLGEAMLALPQRLLPLKRLYGRRDGRRESISYWLTLGERAALPGLRRKLVQFEYGLRGTVPDGMLVRVSSLGPPSPDAFALHAHFIGGLFDAIEAPLRSRYFGAETAGEA